MRKVKGSVLSYPSWSNMWEHLIMWLSSNVTWPLSGWEFCKKIGKYYTMFYQPDTGQEGLNAAPMIDPQTCNGVNLDRSFEKCQAKFYSQNRTLLLHKY